MDHAPGDGAGSEIGGEAAAMRFAPAAQKRRVDMLGDSGCGFRMRAVLAVSGPDPGTMEKWRVRRPCYS